MNNDVFINIALDAALKKYRLFKEKKDYSLAGDFLVYVIGVLSYIYGEADIINPFNSNEKKIFERNLLKYGLKMGDLLKFYNDIDKFYELNIMNKTNNYENKNPYFMFLQEDLINMFLAKYVNLKLSDLELDNFSGLLYSHNSNSEYKRNYNKIMAPDENYVINYYKQSIYNLKHKYSFKLEKKNLLRQDVYDAFKLNSEKIDKLSQKDLDNINEKILAYYRLSPIEPELNDKIMEEIKNKHSKLTLKLVKTPDIVTILLLIFSFACFAASGVIIALKIVGH